MIVVNDGFPEKPGFSGKFFLFTPPQNKKNERFTFLSGKDKIKQYVDFIRRFQICIVSEK